MDQMTTMPLMELAPRITEFGRIMNSVEVTVSGGRSVEAEAGMVNMLRALIDLRAAGGTLYIIGNGGSAAVASHSVVDFLNVGKIRATTVHDSALITCMANDFGYENAFARVLQTVARAGDMLIAISSSGKSRNMINAANAFRELGGRVLTLSGFANDNPLRSSGEYNMWLNSTDYGFVEIGHQFLLHNLADRLRVGAEV